MRTEDESDDLELESETKDASEEELEEEDKDFDKLEKKSEEEIDENIDSSNESESNDELNHLEREKKKNPSRGKFVMVDGMDGSGKGVVVDGLKAWAEGEDMNVLDLREYWKTNQGFPKIDYYDVIISCEPTFTGIGKTIREKMIKNGTNYSPLEIANAYSEDRKELYQKIIIPSLNSGKHVFQERGVITSLVYQPLMKAGPMFDTVVELEGNKFCLRYPPDLLIITRVSPEVTMQRLAERFKKDDAIFENLEFQTKINKIYEGNGIKEFFENLGSMVIHLDTSPPSTEEDTMEEAVSLFKDILDV